MASFPPPMVDRKQKSKLKSMMSRKSISKKEADAIKNMMMREAVNLQVEDKVVATDDDNNNNMMKNMEGKNLRQMLQRKSLSPEDARMIKEMMIREAQQNNNNNNDNINNIGQQVLDTNDNIINNKHDNFGIAVSSNVIRAPPIPKKEKKRRPSKVLFDYTSQQVDEVDISVGEEVEIIEKQSDGWYRVRKTSNLEEGLVPGNYLKEHDVIANKKKDGNISVNSLLNKKSLTASESDDIRRMMTMLSGKSSTNNQSANDPFPDFLTQQNNNASVSTMDNSNNNYNNNSNKSQNFNNNIKRSESNDDDDKIGDDTLSRHALEYWNITKGNWIAVDVALDVKMGVVFVRIPEVENVLTIQISSISAIDVDIDPASTMNLANSMGSINNKFCFRITEREDQSYVFATGNNAVRDTFFADIQMIIDREVETRLDNLIIFGDDDSSKPKVSALRRASIHATKVLAKAKALFPSKTKEKAVVVEPLESTKSLEDEVDDLINLSNARVDDVDDLDDDNIIPPPPIVENDGSNTNFTQRMNDFNINDDGFLT